MNIQMEEMHRAMYGERAQSYHALGRPLCLPLHMLADPLSEPVLYDFMEASLHRYD